MTMAPCDAMIEGLQLPCLIEEKMARATLHYGGRSPVDGAWDAESITLC